MLPIKGIVRPSKLLLIVLISAGFVSLTAADMSFGSYTVKEEVTTSSEAEFEIKVMNLADTSLEVEILSDSDDNIELDHVDQEILNPSIVTETTSNYGDSIEWFLLEDGRYVETETLKVTARSPDTGTKSFDVTLRAGQSSSDLDDHDDGHSLEQEVAQSRTYSFEAHFESSSDSSDVSAETPSDSGSIDEERESRLQALREPFERFVEDDSDSDSESDLDVVESDAEEDDSEDSSEDAVSDQSPENDQSDTAGALTGMFNEAQSSEKTTLVLLAGIIGSIIYLVTML